MKLSEADTYHCYGLIHCKNTRGYLGPGGSTIRNIRFSTGAMIRLRKCRLTIGTMGRMRGIKIWGTAKQVVDAIISSGDCVRDVLRKDGNESEFCWTMLIPRYMSKDIDIHACKKEYKIPNIMIEHSRGWDLLHVRSDNSSRLRNLFDYIIMDTSLGKFNLEDEIKSLGKIAQMIREPGRNRDGRSVYGAYNSSRPPPRRNEPINRSHRPQQHQPQQRSNHPPYQHNNHPPHQRNDHPPHQHSNHPPHQRSNHPQHQHSNHPPYQRNNHPPPHQHNNHPPPYQHSNHPPHHQHDIHPPPLHPPHQPNHHPQNQHNRATHPNQHPHHQSQQHHQPHQPANPIQKHVPYDNHSSNPYNNQPIIHDNYKSNPHDNNLSNPQKTHQHHNNSYNNQNNSLHPQPNQQQNQITSEHSQYQSQHNPQYLQNQHQNNSPQQQITNTSAHSSQPREYQQVQRESHYNNSKYIDKGYHQQYDDHKTNNQMNIKQETSQGVESKSENLSYNYSPPIAVSKKKYEYNERIPDNPKASSTYRRALRRPGKEETNTGYSVEDNKPVQNNNTTDHKENKLDNLSSEQVKQAQSLLESLSELHRMFAKDNDEEEDDKSDEYNIKIEPSADNDINDKEQITEVMQDKNINTMNTNKTKMSPTHYPSLLEGFPAPEIKDELPPQTLKLRKSKNRKRKIKTSNGMYHKNKNRRAN